MRINDNQLDINDLNNWIRGLMPTYKTPRRYKIVDELPRNAMEKSNQK